MWIVTPFTHTGKNIFKVQKPGAYQVKNCDINK